MCQNLKSIAADFLVHQYLYYGRYDKNVHPSHMLIIDISFTSQTLSATITSIVSKLPRKSGPTKRALR